MPLRALLRYFANNEQLIQKLSESYPMRRAAQLTAYVYHRGRAAGDDPMEKMQSSDAAHKLKADAKDTTDKLYKFQNTFSQELRDGFKKLSDDIKKDQKKQ